MSSNVDSELLSLFGRWTLATAQVKRLSDLKIDRAAIEAAARQVVSERGHPERQRALVDAMDEDTAVALCIWMRDPANATDLLMYAKAAARKAK